ncbi:MAG: peptidoglycan-binding domain-containing protein [Phyllobacterium sp.]
MSRNAKRPDLRADSRTGPRGGQNRRKQRDPFDDQAPGGVAGLLMAAGGVVARNPVIAGGATAFLVTMSFVSANALWYQPAAHEGMIFATRPDMVFKPAEQRPVLPGVAREKPRDRSREKEASAGEAATASPQSDPEVAKLQARLADIGFYDGPVDGLPGPATRAAVEAYRSAQGDPIRQAIAGNVPEGGAIGQAANAFPKINNVVIPATRPQRPNSAGVDPVSTTAGIPPTRPPAPTPAVQREPAPKPQPASLEPQRPAPPPSAVQGGEIQSTEIVRVQAGLRAFGHERIAMDGRLRKDTIDAIREFQTLFRLPVTGRPDTQLIAKMQEIGLIN